MKKLLLTALGAAIVAAAPSAASAQTITGNIGATAVIQTVFAFGTASPVDFGVVTPGTAASASGYIPLQRNVGVIYTLPDAATTGRLTGPGGNLTPAYTCGVGTTSSAVTSAFSSCTPATGTTAVLTLGAPTGLLTEYVIFNGSLTAAQTNIAPGTYTGTIRVTATAN
jgi:spore coat protein U-like protein